MLGMTQQVNTISGVGVQDLQWLLNCRRRTALSGRRLVLRSPALSAVHVKPVSSVVQQEGNGSRLRTARRRLGLTQQMLADFALVSLPTVKRAEQGQRLRADTIGLICQVFSDRYRRTVEPEELGLCTAWESVLRSGGEVCNEA